MRSRPLPRLIAVLTALTLLMAAIPTGIAFANNYTIDVQVCTAGYADCTQWYTLGSETTFLAIKQLVAGYFNAPPSCQEFEFWEGVIPQDTDTLATYFQTFDELTIFVTTSCNYAEPTPLYMLWFLVAADNSACLLYSPTHPSIESQGGWCFPEEYNNSWVAVRSCGGFVYSDGSWKCQPDYDAWLKGILEDLGITEL